MSYTVNLLKISEKHHTYHTDLILLHRFELDKLLEQCAKPDKPGDRLTVKDKLLEVLTKIKKEVF